MTVRIFKIFSLLFVLLLNLSCKKDPPIETNSSLKVYDANLPEGHNINDNGFYFMDNCIDNPVDSNAFTKIFGFDNNCNEKFIKVYPTKDLILNGADFFNIKVNKFFVHEKLVIVGNAYKNDTIYGFVTEFDQDNGLIIGYKTFKFGKIDDYFKPSPLDIKKTSYGYLIFHINYLLLNSNGVIEVKKTDDNFNLIEDKTMSLPSSVDLFSTPIYQDNLNGYGYDYIGAIVTPNDDLVVSYWGTEVTFSPSYYVVNFGSDFNSNIIWAKKLIFDFDQYYSSVNKNELFWFNNKILLFTKNNFTPDNIAPDFHSSNPCLYSIDPNSGTIDSKHEIFAYFPYSRLQDVEGDSTAISPENLLSLNIFNEEQIIISGHVNINNKNTAAMVEYDNNFIRSNSFILTSDANRPVTKFHFVGVTSENELIGSGYTPKYITGSSLDPNLSLNQLSVFVSKLGGNGF